LNTYPLDQLGPRRARAIGGVKRGGRWRGGSLARTRGFAAERARGGPPSRPPPSPRPACALWTNRRRSKTTTATGSRQPFTGPDVSPRTSAPATGYRGQRPVAPQSLYLEQIRVFIAGGLARSEYISMVQTPSLFCSREAGTTSMGERRGPCKPVSPVRDENHGYRRGLGLSTRRCTVPPPAPRPSADLSWPALSGARRGGRGAYHGAQRAEVGAIPRQRSLAR